MKALTIWQPWASLIMIGAKPYEFRRWDYRTSERALEGSRIVIHAGARPIKLSEVEDIIARMADGYSSMRAAIAMPLLERIRAAHKGRGIVPLAAGLGTAVLGKPKSVAALFNSPADSDRIDHHMWAWPLRDIVRWEHPVELRGSQGFWSWPLPIEAEAAGMKPLNGEKTHPLSEHALAELRDIAAAPVPSCAVNPGVINRLLRESLVEEVQLPSPFPTHKGRNVAHLQITKAGLARMMEGAGRCAPADNQGGTRADDGGGGAMKIKAEFRGRPTLILGLSHANLDRLRTDGLAGYIEVKGSEMELPFDVIITAAESEQMMLDSFQEGIHEGTKLRISDKLKIKQ